MSTLPNIADAIRLEPGFSGSLSHLVVMGGAVFYRSNNTEPAEVNVNYEFKAADEVSAGPPFTVWLALDVTLKTLYETAVVGALAKSSPDIGPILRDDSRRFFLKFYRETGGLEGCGLHDSTAVLACTQESKCFCILFRPHQHLVGHGFALPRHFVDLQYPLNKMHKPLSRFTRRAGHLRNWSGP